MTNEPYKVSILIPVYGVEKYIERCARSVFEQTYHNLEIIFVDDCTPDHSIEVLQRVLEEYPERKKQTKILHHQKNGGLSVARNTAFAASSGDYVYYLDSDDEMKQNCIEIMTRPLEKKLYDFVIAEFEEVGFPVRQPHISLKPGEYQGREILDDFCVPKWFMMAWNKLVNRQFYQRNQLTFYPGIVHEDDLWSFHLACAAQSMYVLHDETMIYYKNGNSIMSTMKAEREVKSDLLVIGEIRKMMKQYHLHEMKYENAFFNNIYRTKANLERLGKSDYVWYKAVFHHTECRNFREKWHLCFSEGVHPFFFHRLLPCMLGYIYYKLYLKIRQWR